MNMKIYAENKFSKANVKMLLRKGNEEDVSDDEHICSKTTAKRSMKYYLQNTTLHGLKYIAEDTITIPERVFFGLAFIMVVVLSGFFISNIYDKWSASPIIISTSAKQTLATDVPFPAITICNLNQALRSKVSTIARRSSNFTLLMSICDQTGEIGMSYAGTWKFFKSILVEVAQPCSQMLLYCSFGAKTENCSQIFNTVLTDDGLCCTFNALDQSYLLRNLTEDNRFSPNVDHHFVPIDWTPEKGYGENLPPYFYPRVSGGTGSRMGLTVVLNASSAEYFCSKSKSIGFKILVHNPAETPTISNYGFLVTTGREARIPIEPIYQDALPSIRSIKIGVRRCLFSDEGDLVYYRTYSRKNCELECEAKILMDECDCVLYYLPRINPQSKICGPNNNICTNQVQIDIESSNKNVSCTHCLPGCFELNYKATLTSSRIVHGNFWSTDHLPRNLFNQTEDVKDVSILHFYYLSNIFRSTTKSEMFGFTEFLSNTGGLLGLFMGFSIFSLIEIVYYVTVRPYCAIRTMEKSAHRKHEEAFKWAHPIKPKPYKTQSNTWHHDAFMKQKSQQKKLFNKKFSNSLHYIIMQQQTKRNNNDAPILPYLD